MKIVACYKCVPSTEGSGPAGGIPRPGAAELELGQYDLRAVEAGARLAQETGGELHALTAAGAALDNTKLRKGILSRGCASLYGVQDGALDGADGYTTALALKAAVEKIGGVDLVLCGEGSGDEYAQAVGPILGAMLGWPTLNAVCALSAAEDGSLRADRRTGAGVESLSLPLPAVVSVTGDINVPRIPNMRDILGAGKKAVTLWSAEEAGFEPVSVTETVSVLAPERTERECLILEGADAENLDAFAEYIRKSM